MLDQRSELQIDTKIEHIATTEESLLEMRELDHQIKVLKAKYDRIKKGLIAGYFAHHQEYVGSEGLVLATYKTYETTKFLTSEFKKDHKALYNDYSVKVDVAKFDLKK